MTEVVLVRIDANGDEVDSDDDEQSQPAGLRRVPPDLDLHSMIAPTRGRQLTAQDRQLLLSSIPSNATYTDSLIENVIDVDNKDPIASNQNTPSQVHFFEQFLSSQDTSASSFEWDAELIDRSSSSITGPGPADRPFFVNPLPMPLSRMVNTLRQTTSASLVSTGRARAARVEANSIRIRRPGPEIVGR